MKKTHLLLSLLASATTSLALAQAPAATTAAAAATGASPAAAPVYKAKVPKLNRAELDALLAKPEVLIIDVRRPDELTKIGGFPAYLSIQAKDIEKHLNLIPRDRTLVTVSNHAGRAGATGDLLAKHGYKIGGAVGAQDYEAEGGTLTKIAPPPPRVAASAPSSATTN